MARQRPQSLKNKKVANDDTLPRRPPDKSKQNWELPLIFVSFLSLFCPSSLFLGHHDMNQLTRRPSDKSKQHWDLPVIFVSFLFVLQCWLPNQSSSKHVPSHQTCVYLSTFTRKKSSSTRWSGGHWRGWGWHWGGTKKCCCFQKHSNKSRFRVG